MPASALPVAAPPVVPSAGLSARTRRLLGAGVAVAAAAVLGLATWLEPSSAGLGTHEQLAMPACGWITLMDVPCPTCGMTTAFAHAANGNMLASFLAQPLGAVLALATAIALVVGLYTAATGSRVAVMFTRLWGRRGGWVLGLGLMGAWLYKIAVYKGFLG